MRNRLRELRKACNLSQAELADAVEVTRQTINAVEADKYDPSLPLAYKLAAYFRLPVEQLFHNPFLKEVQVTRSPSSDDEQKAHGEVQL